MGSRENQSSGGMVQVVGNEASPIIPTGGSHCARGVLCSFLPPHGTSHPAVSPLPLPLNCLGAHALTRMRQEAKGIRTNSVAGQHGRLLEATGQGQSPDLGRVGRSITPVLRVRGGGDHRWPEIEGAASAWPGTAGAGGASPASKAAGVTQALADLQKGGRIQE
jgi:hypothetical protein